MVAVLLDMLQAGMMQIRYKQAGFNLCPIEDLGHEVGGVLFSRNFKNPNLIFPNLLLKP